MLGWDSIKCEIPLEAKSITLYGFKISFYTKSG